MTLGHWQTWNLAQYPLHHMTYAPAKFEVVMSNSLGRNAFTRNIWFDPRSRSHEALTSTSCALCTCKVWSCYGQWLRRCIYKKKHCVTLTKVTQNAAQYPRHHVTYAPEKFRKFKVPNKGPFVSTDGRPTHFGKKLIYPFSKEKNRYNKNQPRTISVPLSPWNGIPIIFYHYGILRMWFVFYVAENDT